MANPTLNYHLPDIIVSSEYVKIADTKMSKSVGNLITIEELVNQFDSDMIRYYFLKKVNDSKDVNFTMEDFISTINSDLVNGFGNLVNRTLSFVKSKFDGRVYSNILEGYYMPVIQEIMTTYTEVGQFIQKGKVNKALQRAMELVDYGNKFFDESAPWASFKTDIDKCKLDIQHSVLIVANLARVLYPFIPKGCEKLSKILGGTEMEKSPYPDEEDNFFDTWSNADILQGFTIRDVEILYKRLDSVTK